MLIIFKAIISNSLLGLNVPTKVPHLLEHNSPNDQCPPCEVGAKEGPGLDVQSFLESRGRARVRRERSWGSASRG